ncbi:MAG: GTPase ObgE [Spirochaetota bacterium]|nr:GTPase ObgE [Spirochaetota bacterium]
MIGFADETFIDVSAGSGGNGAVSFRREKYVPFGGPDGGDGGTGGSVIFVVRNNLKTLSHLKRKRVYRAENGHQGEGRRRHGRDGRDTEIPVPPGTLIKDPNTGEIIIDLTAMERFVFAKGGKGGLGNYHFSTAKKQTPRYAQKGKVVEERRLHIELAVIADIGLVGLPNAGKSSLLNALTNANPKIGSYPFTTKIPNLGVVNTTGGDFIIADIPGIIEGASSGAGMGFKFLKHISRTKALIFLIDLDTPDFLDVFNILYKELEEYAPELIRRKRIVLGTKTDLDIDEINIKELKKSLPAEQILGISIYTREGLKDLEKIFLGIIGD